MNYELPFVKYNFTKNRKKSETKRIKMTYEGVLTKMQTEFLAPIQYYLVFENSFLNVNQLLGKSIEINFMGFQCLNCGKKKKIFSQGFCYDCFMSSASAGAWIMKPELSTAHLDIEDRDLDYEKRVQLQPHIVYLAFSSEIKVGVTRKTQVPTRWIDQGAVEAISIVEVPNRYLAGITEVALKNHYADKTNWQKMLKMNPETSFEIADLIKEKASLRYLIPKEAQEYFHLEKEDLYKIQFPVVQYPEKVVSLNLNKTPNFSGKLTGIKGQYLLFEGGTVFNVRTYEGYVVTINV